MFGTTVAGFVGLNKRKIYFFSLIKGVLIGSSHSELCTRGNSL